MIPLASQLPQITALVGVIVYLVNGFLGADLTSEQVATFVQALAEVVVSISAIWSWYNARNLARANAALSQKVATMTAALSAPTKPAVKPATKRR